MKLKHILTAASAMFVSTAFAAESLSGGPQVHGIDFQEPVTSIARDIRDLNYMVMLVCLGIAIVVCGAMFYSVFKHRKSKGAVAAEFHESTAVEIAWTLVPLIIVIAMLVPATKVVVAQENTAGADLTVKVTGYQWKWGYEYTDGNAKGIAFYSTLQTPMSQVYGSDTKPQNYLLDVDHPLVVPVDSKVRVLTTSMDVIHGFYVPAFGVQLDAIPGFVRATWFKAEKVGTYYGQCAQICGKGHAFMPIVIKVVSKSDYDAWVKQEQTLLQQSGGALPPSGASS